MGQTASVAQRVATIAIVIIAVAENRLNVRIVQSGALGKDIAKKNTESLLGRSNEQTD